jgi:hypothetical protein
VIRRFENPSISASPLGIDAHVEPFRVTVLLLTTIPGVDELGACVILAEIGRDMSRFPTAGHLISWAVLCPRNDESAGKRRSTRMRKGAAWLKTTLVQCAWAAARKKASYLQAQFHRLRARRGAKKAIGAVAASILTAAYEMLKTGTLYEDLGCNHFDKGARASKSTASFPACETSATPFKSPRCRQPHDPRYRPIHPSELSQRSTHRPPDGGQTARSRRLCFYLDIEEADLGDERAVDTATPWVARNRVSAGSSRSTTKASARPG